MCDKKIYATAKWWIQLLTNFPQFKIILLQFETALLNNMLLRSFVSFKLWNL